MKPLRAMPQRRLGNRKVREERGFAYLMALFMVLAVIIASQVAAQNLLTLGRRDRENDLIWRGNQYTRAIRLYYRKAGHYPQNLEDLEKGLPDLHFLRFAATKDPMSETDGEWRMIYVNAAGQIIGSVRYASLQQMALMDLNGGKLPAPAIQGAVTVASMASPTLDAPATIGAAPSPASPNAAPSQGLGAAPTAGGLSNPASSSPFAAAGGVLDQKPTGPVDGPVLGAFLTGVVSKSDRSSIKVYSGGKKYSEWEFIWNPLEDQARAAQQGLAPQGAIPGQPGQPAGGTGQPPGGIGGVFGPPPGQGAPGASPAPSGAAPVPAPQSVP